MSNSKLLATFIRRGGPLDGSPLEGTEDGEFIQGLASCFVGFAEHVEGLPDDNPHVRKLVQAGCFESGRFVPGLDARRLLMDLAVDCVVACCESLSGPQRLRQRVQRRVRLLLRRPTVVEARMKREMST